MVGSEAASRPLYRAEGSSTRGWRSKTEETAKGHRLYIGAERAARIIRSYDHDRPDGSVGGGGAPRLSRARAGHDLYAEV